MAFTDRGFTGDNTVKNKSAGTAISCNPQESATYINSGNLVVALVACDSISGGGAIGTSAVTDTTGTTYTRTAVYDPSSSAGLPTFAIFWGIANGNFSISSSITFTPSTSSAAKVMTVRVFTKAGTVSGVTSASATASGTGTAISVSNGGTLQADDMVIAGVGWEGVFTDNNGAGDSDTTNGSWSANQWATSATSGGGGASNIGVRGQYKLVTAAGGQTWNITAVNSVDWGAGITALRDTVSAPGRARAGNNRTILQAVSRASVW